MLNNTTPDDRTGHKIEPEGSPVGVLVVSKSVGSDIYLCCDYLITDPTKRTGAYFLTGSQLEDTIKGFETGEWSYEI